MKGELQITHGILTSMEGTCLSCGFVNPPGMQFCGKCGVRLAGDGDPAAGGLSAPIRPGATTSDEGSTFDSLQTQEKLGGERRFITVLFADLCDYTGLSGKIDDEQLYEILQDFLRMLVEKVTLYEGMVDKFIGDGVMALFGAPVAHENSPERAIRSAIAMFTGLVNLNKQLKDQLGDKLKLHVGIHSGPVILGEVEAGAIVDYTAIGDTVNLARRLQESAAPSSILVSETVFNSTRALFEFKPVSPVALKGISHPVDSYYLAGVREKPDRVRGIEGLQSPMVGRERELSVLVRSIEGLAADRLGRMIFVSGEAGIGKSRLMDELKEWTTGKNLVVLEGQSMTYRRSASYWIFHDLLRSYLDATANTSSAQVRERLVAKVSTILEDQYQDQLPYLENLLSLKHSNETSAKRLAYLDAEQLRQHTFLSVRDLLWAEAKRNPVVLILEDLHWVDDLSRDLLKFLVEGLNDAPILILGITRSIGDSRLEEIVRLGKQRLGERCSTLDIQGLDEEQSERLLAHLLGSEHYPAALRDRIVYKSGGIPFYIEEMLRMYVDGQYLRREDGKWNLAKEVDSLNIPVPDNLRDLILARFDRLDPDQRVILQAASVIGRQFSIELLELALQHFDKDKICRAIAALVDRSFILPQTGAEGEFTFRHVLNSDAIYRTLLKKDRARLHTSVGEGIEHLYADQLESQVDILAGHFLRTPHLEKALHYLLLAGEQSARNYANLQANRHFTEARGILSRIKHDPDQALRIFIGMGDVLTFIGEYDQARESYFSALQLIESMQPFVDVQKHCAVHRKLGITFERQGDFEQALFHLKEANKALGKTAFLSPGSKAEILNDLGWIYFLRGNFEEAQKALNIGLSLVEGTEEYSTIASIHNRLGALAYRNRDYDESANNVRKSLALRQTVGDLSGVARLYNNLGLLSLMLGKLREAEDNFFHSINLLEKIGDAEGIALTNINIGLVKIDRGQFDSAGTYFEKALAVSDQIGHRFYLALGRLYNGRLKTALGKYSEAARLLDSSIELFRELGSQDNLIDGLGYLAENCLAWGDSEGAIRWSDAMGEAIARVTSGALSDVSIQKGRMLRIQGTIARLRIEPERASKLLSRSYEIFQSSTEKLEAARTIYEQGLLAKDQQDDFRARQLFHEAGLFFRQIGAEKDLEKVAEALRSLD